MAIFDPYPGETGVSSAAKTWPAKHSVQIDSGDYSDTVDLPFRCTHFIASADGELVVHTENQHDAGGITIQVVKGYNIIRLDRIFATGSDALTLDLRY